MTHPSIPPEDLQFADLAVAQRLCTREQVTECLTVLTRLLDAGVTPLPRLGELLARKGYLSAVQLEATLRMQETPAPAVGRESSVSLPPEIEKAAADPANLLGTKYVKAVRLGAGGMGEVWSAWDRELGRWVALKFLKHDDPQEVARFQREAQTAAGLNHPNIASVYEVGQAGGKPYLAMQLIRGQTLSTVPRNDVRRLVEILRDAALAVHHAHERGVVHRDLKPANLMVEDSRLYVMDFGLAKQAALDSSLSVSGAIMGTPSYMAPEQARGDSARVGPRSDVYCLGATLYELLADRPPFQADDVYALLKKVVEEEPVPLRKRTPRADAELETIVLKCLEKDPDRRYGSARELADELSRWLAGEAILAHPPSAAYRLRKFIARRKGIVVAAGVGLVAVVATLGVLVPRLIRQTEETGRQAALVTAEKEKRAQSEKELKELGHLWSEVTVIREWVRQAFRKPEEIRQSMEKAIEQVSRFALKHPDYPQAPYIRARANLYLGRLEAVEKDLAEALRLDSRFAPARVLQGQVKLERYIRVITASNGQARDARLEAARGLIEEAEKHFAAAAFETLAPERWGIAPTRQDAVQTTLGYALKTYYLDRKRDEARKLLREAHALEPSEEYARWLANWTSGEEEKKWYEEAIRIAPHYAPAYLERGAGRLNAGEYAAAVEDLTQAIRLDPALQSAYNNRAVAYQYLGRLQDTMRDLNAALELQPDYDLALANRAGTKVRLRDFAGALADAERAIALDPANVIAYANRSGARLETGDLEGGIQDADRALSMDPTIAIAYGNRAAARIMKGDYEAGLKDADRAIELDPKTAILYATRAGAKVNRFDWIGAEADATKALELDPTIPVAYSNRAAARISLRRLEEALADCNRAIELDPKIALAYVNRSSVLISRGDNAGAIASATKALELDPRMALGYANRAAAKLQSGALDAAEADFKQALSIDPRLPQAIMNTGVLKYLRGDAEGAIRELSRAIEIAPGMVEGYVTRAGLRAQKGELEGALADCDKAISINPHYPEAYVNRGIILAGLGKEEEALEAYERAIRIEPRHARALTNRGILRRQKGDAAGAVEDYTKAIEVEPTLPEAWVNRALAREVLGQHREAIGDLRKALEVAPRNWHQRKKVEEILERARKEEKP